MKILENKKVIVTGGSKGIGRAIAIGFARKGADVVITYRQDEESAKSTVQEIEQLGRKAMAVRFDLCQPADAESLVEQALSFLVQIDILVNNAGFMPACPFLEMTEAHLNEVIDGNLKGTIRLTQLVCKQLVAQKMGGSILNISSISDRLNAPGLLGYEIAKAGITRFTQSLASEASQYGITVNAIAPGLTDTALVKPLKDGDPQKWTEFAAETPVGRVGQPEDYVQQAIIMVTNPQMTGHIVVIDGGRTMGPASASHAANVQSFWRERRLAERPKVDPSTTPKYS